MATPIIKVHQVPDSFNGINDVLHRQSIEAPDIIFGASILFPIEEASGDNEGIPGTYEGDPKYKILLTRSGNNYFGGNKAWFLNHIGYEPKIYIKKPTTYYNNDVWEYQYISKYDANYNLNYTFLSSGIQLTSEFLTNNVGIQNYDFYATYFYWEEEDYIHPTTSNVRGYYASEYDDYVNFAPKTITLDSVDISTSGDFFSDAGIFKYINKPSGTITLTGYYHTWQRLTNDDLNNFQFKSGEEVPAQISDVAFLIKDFSPHGPWYRYGDVKISNESPSTSLEKFFIQPVLRGKLNSQGYIYEGWGGYVDPTKPWDTHQGQAEETNGYLGIFANTSNINTFLMWEQDYCWASGIDPYYINPLLPSGLDTEIHYNSDWKFPSPCSGLNTGNIITYYRSTPRTPDGRYAFCYSRDNILGSGSIKWTTQYPGGAEFKILQSGMFANDGFPVPDSVYVRSLYSFRDFSYAATQNPLTNPVNSSNWTNSFIDIQESSGVKNWTLQILGVYYE